MTIVKLFSTRSFDIAVHRGIPLLLLLHGLPNWMCFAALKECLAFACGRTCLVCPFVDCRKISKWTTAANVLQQSALKEKETEIIRYDRHRRRGRRYHCRRFRFLLVFIGKFCFRFFVESWFRDVFLMTHCILWGEHPMAFEPNRKHCMYNTNHSLREIDTGELAKRKFSSSFLCISKQRGIEASTMIRTIYTLCRFRLQLSRGRKHKKTRIVHVDDRRRRVDKNRNGKTKRNGHICMRKVQLVRHSFRFTLSSPNDWMWRREGMRGMTQRICAKRKRS